MLSKAIKSGPKSNKSPNLVTLVAIRQMLLSKGEAGLSMSQILYSNELGLVVMRVRLMF